MRTRSRKSKTPQKETIVEKCAIVEKEVTGEQEATDKKKEVEICEKEDNISNLNSNLKSISDEILLSDDEAPLDISLKVSKMQSEEARKKQIELLKEIKKKKTSVRSMREQKNKRQKLMKKIFIPEKLDEELLRCVDKNVSVSKISLTTPVLANKKTTFSDDSSSNDETENMDCKITSCVLTDVAKHNQNNQARVFLQNHFFNNKRISRKKIVV